MSGAIQVAGSRGEPLGDERLLRYLRDVAEFPFSLALERDERLGLSRYHGVQVRRRLAELGHVRSLRISLGRRTGQAKLLELTPAGRDRLQAVGVRVEPPRGELKRRYFAHKVAEHVRRTWPEAEIDVAAQDSAARAPDVFVRLLRGGNERTDCSISFFLIVADDEDAPWPALRDVTSPDVAYVCAASAQLTARLQLEAEVHLAAQPRRRVTITTVGSLLSTSGEAMRRGSSREARPPASTASRNSQRRRLVAQAIAALEHLHDLDWLQGSPLVDLPVVRERRNPLAPIPEAQALRGLLVDAARRAARQAGEIPPQAPLSVFLDRYLEGSRVTEIAAELGVSREWCSRAYRKQAFELAGMQFVRLFA